MAFDVLARVQLATDTTYRKTQCVAINASKVMVHLPEWLWGGDPSSFGAGTLWNMSEIADSSHEWEISLQERVPGSSIRLLETHKIATRANFLSLATHPLLTDMATNEGAFLGLTNPIVVAELNRISAERPDDFAAIAYATGLRITSATGAELPTTVKDAMTNVLIPRFPEPTIHLIKLNPALGLRMAAIRMLLQIEYDSDLLTTRPSPGQDGMIFSSARGLIGDTSFGLSAYLAPLFLSLAPWVWANAVSRPGGIIVCSFNAPVVGRRGEATELLQLFSPHGRLSSGTMPYIAPANFDSAITWWVKHLNRLFTEISDPCLYQNHLGQYDVFEHFEHVLSLEQAFRIVQSLSALERDVHAQRNLLFDALDTIGGIRNPSFDEMCKLKTAQKALEEIEATMTPATAEVLLPRARAAVTALQQLQQGFFLPSRVSGGEVRLPFKQGEQKVPLESAAARYLRMLRNAIHGFGGREGDEAGQVLLASHTGEIPVALPDLAYLYLLRLLARPEDLGPRR
jgi:hypothetical protein